MLLVAAAAGTGEVPRLVAAAVRDLAFLGMGVALMLRVPQRNQDPATSPPQPVAALVSLAAVLAILVAGHRFLLPTPSRQVRTELGLTRPAGRAVVAASLVGSAVIATYFVGAAVLDVQLEVRDNWPGVLLGVLLFHGLAEEVVWRGFAFARLRRHRTFWRAVLLTMPLIALTHAPIIISDGWLVGGMAVVTAALTCLPLCSLWEHGGHTIWAAALLHGLIGAWQAFDRTDPMQFTIVVLVAATLVPLAVFLFGGRFLPHHPRTTVRARENG